MYSAIHEGGHAIFEQNVNPDYDGTVAGSCSYMGIHESQSRFYENILGRNKNFWIPVYAKVQEKMPQLQDVSLDEFYKEVNHVRNSFIRTEADELTYCFHIILRYEIEKAIFRDHVKVEELPALWNQKMQEYLQITPADDALLAEGRISEITKWLNEKIHQYGSTRSPKEVIRYVCGKEVSAEPLIRYFKEKYTKVYNLG